MAYQSKILTSIYGRRLGIQSMSTNESGGSRGTLEFLVGPEALRNEVTTSESTATNLKPFGHSVLTTASSSGVYTLDPPIPGVEKTLTFYTTGSDPIYVKTANNEQIKTTQASTSTVIASSQTALATIRLLGVTTAIWAAVGSVSSAYLKLSTST